jgi:DNA repair exonuclease SbcCD ATPase subunit/DNA repair exonuclease SbcCD nuclease subunit
MPFHYVYHLSDIHIRLFSRRQEYELAFQKVYDLLRSKKHPEKSVVVITGDILHNKIDLQPECTMMTYAFLKELGSIMRTIVIAGNHDALLNNRDRIDSLTSILHDRHPPNVFYYSQTGVYRHDNLVFIVNSLLDDQWIRASDVPRENATDILVGLYHGQVNGWRNNCGYVSETGDKEVSDFDGCDYVMLGDIHKYQYMNAEKTMAYAGSLVSQNFGETDDDHGVLEWDLRKKTSKYHRIHNPYAYKDYHLVEKEKGIYLRHAGRTVPLQDADVPPLGNVKVFLPSSYGLHVPTVLRKTFPSTKFQFQVVETVPATKNDMSVAVVEGPSDEDILTDYIGSRWPSETTEVRASLIKDLLRDFHDNRLVSSSLSRAGWQLEYLHFGHLFGYGPDNRIDLEKTFPKHTVTGIFGKNSAGKSTIIDILSFVLYGKITRSSHGNTIPKEVIHFSEKNGWGEVGLRLGGTRYILRKTCSRSHDKIKIVETFYEVDETGNKIQLTDEQRKKTDKIVQNMIGGYKSFVYTNLFLQQREESFRDMKQAARKDFLYELFGLDWFEKYRRVKEDEWKAVRAEQLALKKRIEPFSEAMWEEKTTTLATLSASLDAEIATFRQLLEGLSEKREACFQQLKPCKFSSLDALRAKKKTVSSLVDTNRKLLTKMTAEKDECLKFLAQHNVEELEAKVQQHADKKDGGLEKNALFSTHSPYHSTMTHREWQEVYKNVQTCLASSSEVTKEWKKKEAVYEQEIRALLSTKPSWEPSNLLSESKEWTYWTERYEAMVVQQERETQEWKEMETTEVAPFSEEMETVLGQLEKGVQEFHKAQCRYEMVRQQLENDEGTLFNKNCTSCMSNPHYLERKENATQGKRLKSRVTSLEKDCKAHWAKLGPLFPSDSAPSFSSWDELLDAVRELFSRRRQAQQRCCSRKQEILQSRQKFSVFEARYKNTVASRTAKKIDTKVTKLEKQMASDPLRETYDRMVACLGNLAVYSRIHELWSDFLDGDKGLGGIEDIVEKYRAYEGKSKDLGSGIEKANEDLVQHRMEMETLRVEEEWFMENEALQKTLETYEEEKRVLQRQLGAKEKEFQEMERQRSTTATLWEEWKKDTAQYLGLLDKTHYLELLVTTTERDGLPLFLLKKKLPVIEGDVNALISPFLEKKLVLCVEEKEVVVGIETSSKKVSNYLGGMESFIIDLSLKLGFSKFANLPRSNLFIIDEGISVLDQERISNISHLFDFLSNITDHVLLISHLPAIKDFVNQSIEVVKEPATQKSRLLVN